VICQEIIKADISAMKDFLRQLKLTDQLTTELEISRSEFVARLSAVTDKGDTGIFSDAFDVFSSSKNEFKGRVHYAGFEIKRRKRMFEPNLNMAVATGTIHERDGQVRVETEVNGFHDFFIFFYVGLTVFYIIFILSIWNSDAGIGFYPFLFVVFHGLLMFTLPYFMIRRSVKRLKYELEREFYYLTKRK
jgi:hypothetical protein